MQEFEEVALLLNSNKTVVLINEAENPSHLWTHTSIKLQVENGSGGHTWLGCIRGVGEAGRTSLDINHHIQAASKAFFANKTTLCDRSVPVKGQLKYGDAVVSPVAVFGSAHRTIHQKDLHQFDVACRKFLRAVVWPPSNLDWSRPWHEILHEWNGTVHEAVEAPFLDSVLEIGNAFHMSGAIFASGCLAKIGTRYASLAPPDGGGVRSILQTS